LLLPENGHIFCKVRLLDQPDFKEQKDFAEYVIVPAKFMANIP